jgi:hypothetical protein
VPVNSHVPFPKVLDKFRLNLVFVCQHRKYL